MPTILFVHGVEVEDARESVASLAPIFESLGFHTERYEYDSLRFWQARGMDGRRQRAAQLLTACRIASRSGPVIIVAHSNGCLMTLDAAARQGVTGDRCIEHLVFLSPALDRDAFIPTTIKRVDVHYTRSDWALRIARWLFWHPWGDMGRRGYSGFDPVVHDHDGTGYVAGHSGWLLPKGHDYVRSAVANPLAAMYGLTEGTETDPYGLFSRRTEVG